LSEALSELEEKLRRKKIELELAETELAIVQTRKKLKELGEGSKPETVQS